MMKRFHFEVTSVVPREGEVQEVIKVFRHEFIRAHSSVKGAKKVGPVELRYVAPSNSQEITVSWWGNFDLPTEKEAAELEYKLCCLGRTRAAMHFYLGDVPEHSVI